MPLPFEGPLPTENWSLYCKWSQNVEPEMKSPELLWVDYWERFNTVKIPILHEHGFFETALEIAKLSKDKEEFEQRFEEHNRNRKEELLKSMSKAWTDTFFDREVRERGYPDALRKARSACLTGCLHDFLQVVKGVVYGWEAEEVFDNTPRPCKSCGSTQLLSCLKCNSNLDLCGNCGQPERGCSSCMSQYADTNPAYLYRTHAESEAFKKRQEYLNRIVWDAEEVDDEQKQLDDGPSYCISCGSTRLLYCKLCALKVNFCGDCGEQPDSCLSCSTQYFDSNPEQTANIIYYEQITPPSSDGSNANRLSAAEFFTFSTEHNRALEDKSSSEEEETQNFQSVPRRRNAFIQQATDSATDNATSSITEEPQTSYQRETRSPSYDNFVDAVEYQEPACSTPTSSSTANHIINAPASDQTTLKKRKRVSFSGVDDVCYYRQESQSTLSSFASTQQATTYETWIPEIDDYGRVPKRQKLGNSPMRESRKRSRYNDDDDDNGNYTRKRQKFKGSSMLGSKFVNSASPLAGGQNASKKRSRYNDGDDNTNNHAQKLQRITDNSFYGRLELDVLIATDALESALRPSSLEPESVDSPSPPAASHRVRYFDEDDSDDDNDISTHTQMLETPAAYSLISRASSPTHQGANSNKRRKKSSRNLEAVHSPRSGNRRSLRRQRQSEFWELDGLGRPRST